MTRKIQDLTGLIAILKTKLPEYLEKVGTTFSSNGQQFQCPNRTSHANQDATPSCGFFPNGESWHCFVCQESGDIFKAAHYLEGKPKDGSEWVSENVEYLAGLLKVEVKYAEMTGAEKLAQQTYDALKFATAAAHVGISKSSGVLKYTQQRGWTDETIRQFHLGYCDYDRLSQALAKRDFTYEVLIRAGLVNKSLLHHRLLFPIKDARGRSIGFASRTLLSNDESRAQNIQRYLNSDSNAAYKKSETLYNINQIKDEDTIWVVEGYADVITLYQKGVKNVVGLGGVAFTEDHIQVLLKKGVKTLILCLDNDEEGRRSEERILNQITQRHGLSILIKNRDDCKDPDSCLQKHDYLLESGVTALFEHYLKRYEKSQDKKDRDKALRSILLEQSPIDRERLCKAMAKTLGIRVEVILEEIQLLIDKADSTAVNVLELMRGAREFESQLLDFETKAWKRGKLLGLATSHPIFTNEMDGIQNRFYIVAGEEGTGKSAFIRSLMTGILESNPDKVFILYFSIDDSIPTVIPLLLAADTRLEINAMQNPKWRIEKNENLTPEFRESALRKRQEALKKIQIAAESSFAIKDESTIKDTDDMEKAICIAKARAGDKQLVVFVDSLHRAKQAKKFHESVREQAQQVSDTLKKWCTVYGIPVIATAEFRKLNTPDGSTRRPTADDIAEARDFKFDAECLMLIYNDMEANRRRPDAAKLKWEWEVGSGTWYPVVEVYVGKNKTSAFSKRCLYYKFIPKCAKMFEATTEEQTKYRRESLDD